ncbi:hypothetical protein ACROYT_G032028 [Oculina patagonica]
MTFLRDKTDLPFRNRGDPNFSDIFRLLASRFHSISLSALCTLISWKDRIFFNSTEKHERKEFLHNNSNYVRRHRRFNPEKQRCQIQ